MTIDERLDKIDGALTNHITEVTRRLSVIEADLAPIRFVKNNPKLIIAAVTALLGVFGYKAW